ncbi:MAG: mandelate racemase/muconate lactonizing enzyme family protein [Bacteroidota bacterium]
MITRRTFLHQSSSLFGAAALSPPLSTLVSDMHHPTPSPFKIATVDSNFEREALARPFGFKGGAITEVWQTVARLQDDAGRHRIGLGTQSVLWSDSRVSARHSENGGNALMYAMSEYALQASKGQTFSSPIEMVDALLEEVLTYGKNITGQADLRKTFALNAMVGLDNAAWLLYADANGFTTFDEMIPGDYQAGLPHRHTQVASIPALGYGTSMDTIKELADQGFFIMKIKIGAPGTQSEMLAKDIAFLEAIHQTIGHYETPHTPSGKIPYYFDANGRYEDQDTLHRFLDHAEKIGALSSIAVMEEPFGEHNQEDVSSLAARGPRIAADESAHTDEDALARMEQGYNCIALKAIAKTLSMTLKIAELAEQRNVPCFCADLTVNPLLVDWNKCVAARLRPFPDLPLGLQETNGWQNYRDWNDMRKRHPQGFADWTHSRNGVYELQEDFYQQSAGIFDQSPHYEAMFSSKK